MKNRGLFAKSKNTFVPTNLGTKPILTIDKKVPRELIT